MPAHRKLLQPRCAVMMCNRDQFARRLCKTHYHRWWMSVVRPARRMKFGTIEGLHPDRLAESLEVFIANGEAI